MSASVSQQHKIIIDTYLRIIYINVKSTQLFTQFNTRRSYTPTIAFQTYTSISHIRREETRLNLGSDMKSGTGLDLVASRLTLNDDASFRGIARASSSMNQEARASTHVIGGGRIEVIAVGHALESVHISESVSSLRKRSDILLALAAGVIAA